MCRNIRTLYNFEPAATSGEVRAAALQYVRKVSGSTNPSAANRDAFDAAVDAVADITQQLLDSLVTSADPKDREVEAAKARKRAALRYGTPLDDDHDHDHGDHTHTHDHDHPHAHSHA